MKHGKRYNNNSKIINNENLYDLEEAVDIIKKTSSPKFEYFGSFKIIEAIAKASIVHAWPINPLQESNRELLRWMKEWLNGLALVLIK